MNDTPHRYTAELAGRIETAWQDRWEEQGLFRAPNPAGPWADPQAIAGHDGAMFVLDMFPYPSGKGLHIGHPLGYIATDVTARFNRMLGKNVLYSLGYDAFGLPAEQYAVQTGQHPRTTTLANIDIMARQLKRLGMSYDDRRAIRTIDPDYYRWTQWIFLQIYNAWYDPEAVRPDGRMGRARPISDLIEQYASGERSTPDGRPWAELSDVEQAAVLDEHRLAYTSKAPVNWAPGLGTVLSNEEVTNEGRSERGNFPAGQHPVHPTERTALISGDEEGGVPPVPQIEGPLLDEEAGDRLHSGDEHRVGPTAIPVGQVVWRLHRRHDQTLRPVQDPAAGSTADGSARGCARMCPFVS